MKELDWVEFLEGDLDKSTKHEMQMILKFSAKNRKFLYGLKQVKSAVKSMGEVKLPESKGYYDQLQNNIMLAVKKEAQKTQKSKTSVLGNTNLLRASQRKAHNRLLRMFAMTKKQKQEKLKSAQYYFSLGN